MLRPGKISGNGQPQVADTVHKINRLTIQKQGIAICFLLDRIMALHFRGLKWKLTELAQRPSDVVSSCRKIRSAVERTGLYSSIIIVGIHNKFWVCSQWQLCYLINPHDYSAPSDYCLNSPCSSVNMSLAKIFTKIRDPALLVDGFVQYELNQLANSIYTL